ncbi:MAG: hypothetical protein FJX35_06360 [Alphaproteobacteria bacterium]|nr:hypothetical protein [Alphaproteobacteria bacterium]
MTALAAARPLDRPDAGAIDVFARSIVQASWFAALGAPLSAGEDADVRTYLAGLAIPGLADVAIDIVADWPSAKRIADAPDWDRRWWNGEEALRQAALQQAIARLGQGRAMAALTRVTEGASDRVHGLAASAAQRDGVADQALVRAAAGAATQACYQAALALAAEAERDHAFTAKYRLFAAGRWPLGLVGGHFFLF